MGSWEKRKMAPVWSPKFLKREVRLLHLCPENTVYKMDVSETALYQAVHTVQLTCKAVPLLCRLKGCLPVPVCLTLILRTAAI